MVVTQEIDDQVVDYAAFGVEHATVKRLAGEPELVDVVGDQVTQVGPRTGATDVDHGHVRNVEHAGRAAHRLVLGDLRTVVDRHVPAGEIDYPGAGVQVLLI